MGPTWGPNFGAQKVEPQEPFVKRHRGIRTWDVNTTLCYQAQLKLEPKHVFPGALGGNLETRSFDMENVGNPVAKNVCLLNGKNWEKVLKRVKSGQLKSLRENSSKPPANT